MAGSCSANCSSEDKFGIVSAISSSLDSGNYKEALSALTDEKHKERFSDYCWELVARTVDKIEDNTIIIKPSLYGACEQIISFVLEKCSTEDALLEFIEHLERSKNDAQIGLVLPILQKLLQKLPKNKKRSLEWCLYAMNNHIEKIKIDEHQLDGDERKLIDSDPSVRRLIKFYTMIVSFYQPFIDEIVATDDEIKTKQILTDFLISLLGKPMVFLDIDPIANAQSEARQACATIIQDICKLQKNVLKFLCHFEKKDKERVRVGTDAALDFGERMNTCIYASFFYVAYSGHFEIPDSAIPHVYSNEYIIHNLMVGVNRLLKFTEYGPLTKALALYQALNNRLAKNTSCELLSSSVHYDMCSALVNVTIYSVFQSVRKSALDTIAAHINKFDYKGRYALIKYLVGTANHSGMIGYAISLYKQALIEAFDEEILNDCFSGEQLSAMLHAICYLPHAVESDLMEHADQIITTLNFLRFLVLKDKDNVTGIKDMMPTIEKEYLSVLGTAIKMSKAHYALKLKDTNEGADKPGISVCVGGTVLDHIPADRRTWILESAINGFHLMEGLLARLNECINSPSITAIRASRRIALPLAPVPVNNTQRIISRSYCNVTEEKTEKLPAKIASPEHEDQQYEENVKTMILDSALAFVLKTGWTIESLSSGAKAVGYPSIAHGLFPNGGGDLVHYFNVKCNEQLVAQMKSWPKEDLKDAKVPAKFLENAIVTRLLMIEPYKSTWPKAMAAQTMPSNVPNGLATLLSLVDDICYHSGDRSVDFNWYVRRVGLAGIYKTAELFYLTDRTPDNSATRNFVSSRIRDAQLVQMALNLNPVAAAPQTLSAAFVTAKNILGINPLK